MKEQQATRKREKTDSSLVLFDLDIFKRVNDKHGHLVGDDLLKRVGHAIQYFARKGDTVARIGGEEFVFFLPTTSATDAPTIAEHISNLLQKKQHEKRYLDLAANILAAVPVNNPQWSDVLRLSTGFCTVSRFLIIQQ